MSLREDGRVVGEGDGVGVGIEVGFAEGENVGCAIVG